MRFPPTLSWPHYIILLKVTNPGARSFYEIEAAREGWSSRELERQVASLLFERLAKSRDKEKVLDLARRGHELDGPSDVLKNPFVLEFIGLHERDEWRERELEQAIIDRLESPSGRFGCLRRSPTMAKASPHKWEFRARFRRHAFGWKSQPAIKRIKEAVSEIKKVARKDKLLAAEGAVLFLEKVSPALEHVDSSSGSIGTAVNNAIAALVDTIATAPADEATREKWLERLWGAYQDDQIPYIELLGDYWGELCVSKEIASRWADQLIGTCKMAWIPDPNLRGFFKDTTNCLSALLAAERYDELLALLDMAPYKMWHYRQYGVKALAALGKEAEAIRYAEEGRGLNDSPIAIARACEEVLLSSGFADEAYERYGLLANQAGTHAAWFRAVAKKYPHKKPAEILDDLLAETPGEEGKWFAAAKDAKLLDEAIALANRTPCSPQTLTRAARDFAEKNPAFAVEAGMAALRWLVEGYGYEITGLDVLNAYSFTMKAAENSGCTEETHKRIHDLVARESFGERLVTKVLGRQFGLS